MTTIRVFRHHVDSSLLMLSLMELLVLFGSLYAGTLVRFLGDWSAITISFDLLWPIAALFATAHWLCFWALGLYQPNLRDGFSGVVVRLGLAMAITTVVLVVLFYAIPQLFVGRGIMGLSTAIALLLLLAGRLVFYTVVGIEQLKSRVLVIGAGKRASQIANRMRRRSDTRNFRLLGYYPLEDDEIEVDQSQLVRSELPLCELIRKRDVDEVVIAVDDRRGCVPVQELLKCRLRGVNVVDVQTFFERESYKILVEMLKPSYFIFSDGFSRNAITDGARRGLDIFASLLLIALTWPLMLITVIAIKLEDGLSSPILYKQERVGARGKTYHVMKFRSMIENAEAAGAQWAQKNDMRVTKVGDFIRKYRIDELPQAFNVLLGEMSFVGPRPERPVFVDDLGGKIPFYHERHLVKPGITGWAQLNYPYGASERDALEKLQYDLYYVKNRSLLLDLMILVQTVEVILFGRGR